VKIYKIKAFFLCCKNVLADQFKSNQSLTQTTPFFVLSISVEEYTKQKWWGGYKNIIGMSEGEGR